MKTTRLHTKLIPPKSQRERIEMMSQMLSKSQSNRIATASLSARSINDVSSNPNLRLDADDMSIQCDEIPVVNQRETGTCWLQAGVALMSCIAKRRRGIKIRLSVPYLAFFDKLEKAHVFMAAMSQPNLDPRIEWHWLKDGPITDGGTWSMFMYLIRTYGAIPHDAMLPTYQSLHSYQLNMYINRYLRSIVPLLRDGRILMVDAMKTVHDALLRAYSLPPSIVTLVQKTHGIDLKTTPDAIPSLLLPECWNHVLLTHAPDRSDGAYIGPYYNDASNPDQDYFICTSLSIIVNGCIAQLQSGTPVWFTADVQHDFSSKRGMGAVDMYNVTDLLNISIADAHDKAQRMRNGNTAPVHAMLITAVSLDSDGVPEKWRIQNSWGKKRKYGSGFLTVTHEWFSHHVFQVAIETSYVPAEVVLKKDAIKLPPWDIFATVAI